MVCPETAATSARRSADDDPGPVYISRVMPYDPGPLVVGTRFVEACQRDAPVPIRIHAPLNPGTYATVLFIHGFMTPPTAYDDMLRHLASHGFVVIVPQLVGDSAGFILGEPSLEEQAELAARVLDWAPDHVEEITGVVANTRMLAVAGHSLGAKVAWMLLARDENLARAVAAVDPVDATPVPLGNGAPVTAQPAPFSLPSLVLGAGIQGLCSFAGANHQAYFEASASPAWHLVARDYGHQDMLDEEDGQTARLICGSGPDRDGMRRMVGGALAAFLRGELQGDVEGYGYLNDPDLAPVKVDLETH